MKQQQEKPTLPQTPRSNTEKPLTEAELDKTTGGLASSVLKKLSETNTGVIGKI